MCHITIGIKENHSLKAPNFLTTSNTPYKLIFKIKKCEYKSYFQNGQGNTFRVKHANFQQRKCL